MTPVSSRLFWSIVSFWLPTLAVVALAVYFYIVHVPAIVESERDRVVGEYRNVALALQANPEAGAVTERMRGEGPEWVKRRRMKPGYWGFVPPKAGAASDKVLVWYEDDAGRCVALEVPPVAEADYHAIFYGFGFFAIFVLVGVTVLGAGYLVRYVNAREDFMAATAHDLTTPLVGMRHLIGRDDDSAKVLNERMIRLVANIKDFLRLGGRRAAPEIAPVDLAAAYAEAYALFREDYRDAFEGADVALEVAGAARAMADSTLVVQIIWNLLGNDLKYAAPFGKVRVRIADEGDFVRMEFIDEGKGMTAREMARAFERYYRAKSVMESGKGGFGIGLCTSREFAEAMGGELSLRANTPTGCIFTLRLPRA